MKIVIDIPEKVYEVIRKCGGAYFDFGHAIYNGEPLDEVLETAERQGYYAGYSEAMREANE